MTDEEFLSALDLLDSLVDGNMETVTKSRVVLWKQTVRERIAKDRAKLVRTLDEAKTVVAQSILDQDQWVSGMDITPEEALTMASGVIRDLAPVFDQLSGPACPLDHQMCPRAWTKDGK